MNKLKKIVFRLKCFFSIPLYLVFLKYNRNRQLSNELSMWKKNIHIINPQNEFLTFISIFAYLKEYRSLFFYRTGSIGAFLSFFIPHLNSLHFITDSKYIGSGLVIQHGYSTIIWPQKMGDNCQIWHNVTIGRRHPFGNRPTIGNNVKICTGSICIGDISIGDNVVIGAGTVVVKNIPSNCVVIGNPARIIKENGTHVNKML